MTLLQRAVLCFEFKPRSAKNLAGKNRYRLAKSPVLDKAATNMHMLLEDPGVRT